MREDRASSAPARRWGPPHDFKWRVVSVPRGKTFADSALTALLALDEFPDAICCQMDMMAIPLVSSTIRRTADTVNLTTMRQDPYAMGRAAATKGHGSLSKAKPLENSA